MRRHILEMPKTSAAIFAAAALALSAGITFLHAAPDDPSAPAAAAPTANAPTSSSSPTSRPEHSRMQGRDQKAKYLTGSVQGYNVGPHGMPDGLLIKVDHKLIQINCPPTLGAALPAVAPNGDEVKITALPERSSASADHEIYRLVMLTNSKGQQLNAGPGLPGQNVRVEGSVKQLNYDPRGHINGATLDTGDFVHLGMESAQQLKLAVGQKLAIEGVERPMMLGHNAVDARTVNGFAVLPPQRQGPDRAGPQSPDAFGSRGPGFGGPRINRRGFAGPGMRGWRMGGPEMGPPEFARRGMRDPGMGGPGMGGPGMQGRGMRGPGMGAPGMQGPGMQGPGMGAPGMGGPGMQGRGMRGPGMGAPGMQGPGMQGPGTSGPRMDGPGMQGRGMRGPGMDGPGMHNRMSRPGMGGPGMDGPGMGGPGFGGPREDRPGPGASERAPSRANNGPRDRQTLPPGA